MNQFTKITNITIKNSLVFLTSFISFLSLKTSVLAQVTLPNPLGSTSTLTAVIANVATYIATIVGGLSIIMFIWAGILYLSAGMSPGNVQKANKVVFYATIGLAVALAGAGLVQLTCYVITGSASCP